MKGRKVGILVLLTSLIILLSGCGDKEAEQSDSKPVECPVSITLVSEQNLLFSTYDISVFIDGSEQGVIEHGSKGVYTTELTEGEHELTLKRVDDGILLRSISFELPEDTKIGYTMKSKKDTIELSTLESAASPVTINDLGTDTIDVVKEKLKDTGFNNIKLNEIPDLRENNLDQKNIVTDIKIGGVQVMDGEEEFFLDTEVVLEYHTEYKVVMNISYDLLKNKNYAEVQGQLEELGFTKFELEPQKYDVDASLSDSVITVWIGDCNLEDDNQYQPGDLFEPEETVRIIYREYHEPLPILTVDNCPELATMLTSKSSNDPSYKAFSEKYYGETIEFDGRVDFLMEYQDDLGTYSMLLSAGDFDPNYMRGPVFKFERLTAYSYDEENGRFIDDIYVGRNIHIIAKVGSFNESSEVFTLTPESITLR